MSHYPASAREADPGRDDSGCGAELCAALVPFEHAFAGLHFLLAYLDGDLRFVCVNAAWWDLHVQPLNGGQPGSGLLLSLIDVTAHRRIAARFRAIFESAGDALFLTVLLPKLRRRADAEVVANKLINALRPDYEVGAAPVSVGCSIGIACFPDDGADADELLTGADRAMFSAKQAGRNRCAFVDRGL